MFLFIFFIGTGKVQVYFTAVSDTRFSADISSLFPQYRMTNLSRRECLCFITYAGARCYQTCTGIDTKFIQIVDYVFTKLKDIFTELGVS